jgi:SAM-dependent methyltransferase
MDLKRVEELLEAFEKTGGNYSVVYPIVKDRLGNYTEEELFGAEELLFFEERYLKGLKHMHENNIHGHILDIGCQFGFQSELFLDEASYTGVDVFWHRFFNQEHPKVSYHIGSFPNRLFFNMEKYIVFSSMSLGYFPIRGENGEIEIHTEDERYLDVLVDALRPCKHLYIATTEELLNRLKENFPKYELLDEHVFKGGPLHKPSRFDMYYFGKE